MLIPVSRLRRPTSRCACGVNRGGARGARTFGSQKMFLKKRQIFRISGADEEVPEAKMGPSPHQKASGGFRNPLFRQKTLSLTVTVGRGGSLYSQLDSYFLNKSRACVGNS